LIEFTRRLLRGKNLCESYEDHNGHELRQVIFHFFFLSVLPNRFLRGFIWRRGKCSAIVYASSYGHERRTLFHSKRSSLSVASATLYSLLYSLVEQSLDVTDVSVDFIREFYQISTGNNLLRHLSMRLTLICLTISNVVCLMQYVTDINARIKIFAVIIANLSQDESIEKN